jgi:hypothetical protein
MAPICEVVGRIAPLYQLSNTISDLNGPAAVALSDALDGRDATALTVAEVLELLRGLPQ